MTEADRVGTLSGLGPQSERMLARAGIRSIAQLRKVGAVAAYVRVKRRDRSASLNLLYALVGAIEGCDWREVKRTRKLELLVAIEDATVSDVIALKDLRNIGPAMLQDLTLLGVNSVAQLARADADRLYSKLQKLTGTRQDPCVWDTFAAAIHQSRTGEALPWWHFTKVRKRRQAQGMFLKQNH